MRIKGAVWALGAMSGTSLDGVDAAQIFTDGETITAFGDHAYRAYSDAERATIRAALGHWPGTSETEAAAEVVETTHAVLLSGLGSDIIGFHGQTLAHDPDGRGTHQAGNGAILAKILDRPVVWDFRSNDVGLGGQGAPLAPFFHHACARYLGFDRPVGFLNMGGVGNISYVDPRISAPEADGALVAFDTGPANAPLNDLMQRRLNRSFDENGDLASSGTPDQSIVARFLAAAYFLKIPPKSLDRDSFPSLLSDVAALSDADAAATLVECAASAVAHGFEHMPKPLTQLFVCGGGRRNGHLMSRLKALCPCPVVDIDETGLDGDMLEAQAFGYLAVRVAQGLPTSAPSTTGVATAVGGGQISTPRDL